MQDTGTRVALFRIAVDAIKRATGREDASITMLESKERCEVLVAFVGTEHQSAVVHDELKPLVPLGVSLGVAWARDVDTLYAAQTTWRLGGQQALAELLNREPDA